MLRCILKNGCILCTAVVAPRATHNLVEQEKKNETGWDRIKKIYTADEWGNLSPELSTIYQTIMFSGLAGACYGGVLHSREAYLRFIERNEASKFMDHYDAKKKLQDFIIVNFAKGAFKWSWRIAVFAGTYMSVLFMLAAYRGTNSIMDYTLGGLISGSVYRWNYGLNGIVVGGTLGGMIGFFAGILTLYIFRLTGTSFDEVNQWNKEHLEFRERNVKKALDKSVSEKHQLLLDTHDEAVKQQCDDVTS